MKAMILAAGYGTRLRPLTDFKPKALIEIKGLPLIEIIIKRLISFGYQDIIVNVHHFGEQIAQFLREKDYFGINIQISDESEKLLDTGGGILKARWFLDDEQAFLVYNVDIISDIDLAQMLEFHKKESCLATLAVRDRKTNRKLIFDSEKQLCEWVNLATEQKKISRTANGKTCNFAYSGIQIIEPRIFDLITEEGAFSVIDMYLRLAKENSIKGFVHDSGYWCDMGKYQQVMELNNQDLDFIVK
jgi:NDP-sugar pyrophosphorylase family protein